MTTYTQEQVESMIKVAVQTALETVGHVVTETVEAETVEAETAEVKPPASDPLDPVASGKAFSFGRGKHVLKTDPETSRIFNQTGWVLDGAVVEFDGKPFVDSNRKDVGRTVPGLGYVNTLLPCRKRACMSNRHGRNMYCLDHKRQARSVYKQWAAAGKPRADSPAWKKYLRGIPKNVRNA